MANRIDPLAVSIKGSDPRHLLEKITREKVYGSVYWKQECFGLTAETIVDKATELRLVRDLNNNNSKSILYYTICYIHVVYLL